MSPTSPLHILQDSGIPAGSTDYTTVVILHGYGFHSAIFEKLVPLGAPKNSRIILVNRRDYPGSKPYTPEELALISARPLGDIATADSIAAAKRDVDAFMLARGQEVYELLEGLVKAGSIPVADRENNKGGIVVAGWSLGTGWMTALLAYATSLPPQEVKLSKYMQRVVFLDAPHRLLGYVPPVDLYNPLFDAELAPEAREDVFALWHAETLALRTYQKEPPPTLTQLTAEEIARTTFFRGPEGSEALVINKGTELGTWRDLREAALRAEPPSDGLGGHTRGSWADVEVLCVTCEHSICDTAFTRISLEKEVADARAKGVPMRNVRFVMIKGANHFIQWHEPELMLRALVGSEEVLVYTGGCVR
ncbi:Alpha/Beta hydrolase protein [Lenzites betulinus]|nr:Alpha/Beta hydrolase protein [Lenzites betulinus]